MENMLDDIFSSSFLEPIQIKLSRRTSKKLRSLGIRGIFIVDYDENYGPYLKFYTSKKASIFKQITENPAFLADILLLTKETKEMLLRDERSLIIFRTFDKKGMKLIIVETTKEFRDKAIDFLDSICIELGSSNLDSDIVSKIIEEKLIRG